MSQKLNIMIVDDSPTLRQVIKRQLEQICLEKKMEVEYFEAGNGEQAELLLQECLMDENPINIIFLDWMMPAMTGFEFLQKIRQIPIFDEFPDVIMLTAETYSDQITACLKYNVSSYVIKPFVQQNLQDALEIVLQKRQLKYAV